MSKFVISSWEGLVLWHWIQPSIKLHRRRRRRRPCLPLPPRLPCSQTLPTTDAEIESAGISFLDPIKRSLGLSNGLGSGGATVGENGVGQAHHKKTGSHCSVDWWIPNDDLTTLLRDTSADDIQKVQRDSRNTISTKVCLLLAAKRKSARSYRTSSTV